MLVFLELTSPVPNLHRQKVLVSDPFVRPWNWNVSYCYWSGENAAGSKICVCISS
jgi:hypothetical protein